MDLSFDAFLKTKKAHAVQYLKDLVALQSMDLQATTAQSLVYDTMQELGLSIDQFGTDATHLQSLDDYCPCSEPFHPDATNLIGYTPYKEGLPSLLLFAHIDTECSTQIACKEENGRVYGLGSADDKGGIASMLLSLAYYKEYYGCLPYNVVVMSTIGKRGGVAGTLIACDRLRYAPDVGVYLHPAETGLGLNEIKHISLGVLDFTLETHGTPGRPHVDLDAGESANHQLALLMSALVKLNHERVGRYGNTDEYGTKINIGTMQGGTATGVISQSASCKFRVHFGKNETMQSVTKEIVEALDTAVQENAYLFANNTYTLTKGYLRATFAMMERNHPFITLLEENITSATGITEYIYQAHGASDIRLPMLFNNTPTVGIGCLCYLPTDDAKHEEWIDIADYLASIDVMMRTMEKWCEKAPEEKE